MRLVLLAPYCDGTDVGESHCAFEWVQHLAEQFEVTLLTLQRQGRQPVAEQLPHVPVVSWPEPILWRRHERVNAMMKPAYFHYYWKARQWLRDHLNDIDLVHQIAPLAMRYPCPATGLGLPYIIGPLGGSLDAPKGLRDHTVEGVPQPSVDRWYARLRWVDHWRFSHDPWLRRSYAEAATVIGVGEYVRGHLADIPIQRFWIESELGVSTATHDVGKRLVRPKTTLLHIGRGVRTKGLQEAVQCLTDLKEEYPSLRLVSAGQGPEIERCRHVAATLGVADRCQFLGQVPRERVEKLYQEADIFLFPSVREPSGSVVFEAMNHGLPIVVPDLGGPGQVVDQHSGMAVPWENAAQFRAELARAVRHLLDDPAHFENLSTGAQKRVALLGAWPQKIERMASLYQSIVGQGSNEKPAVGEQAA